MKLLRFTAALAMSVASLAAAQELPEPIAEGKFQPTWDSLMQNEQPQWFRDAKFGIWAHWSAQCVPEAGDWYARFMYMPRNMEEAWQRDSSERMGKLNRQRYGHPSEFGFKDIINLWKAERFEPEKLLALYKRAGAKYFVALANHHCNFDAWDSKHHEWNSVKVGPKKDLIGMWAQAARAEGLRFGVSVHASRAWSWYEPAQGADTEGPYAGVPYDGKQTRADGKGKWWEGLDPRELYAQNHEPGEPPSQAYKDKFYLRTKDLIDSYQPDLIYYDDWRLPLDERVGLSLIAHHYNASAKWHGENQAVVNTKGLSPTERKAITNDIERGRSEVIEQYPWQTCTCIGQWHYNADVYKNNWYKSSSAVLEMLADIVAKNGNLLLSVPLRADGTPDEKEVNILEEIAAWMDVNGEAIFATRPWKTFGEGPGTREKGGMFSESGRPGTSRDIRFTTKGDTLYAIVLAPPRDGICLIRTLARADGAPEITKAQWLGSGEAAEVRHDDSGLRVVLPNAQRPAGPVVLKIPAAVSYPPQPVNDDSAIVVAGSTALFTDTVTMNGQAILEQKAPEGNVGGWTNPTTTLSWKLQVKASGTYTVALRHAGPMSEVKIQVGESTIAAAIPGTGPYTEFQTSKLGTINLAEGEQTLTISPANAATWRPINLAQVQLERMP